jgi:fructokinase
MKTIDVTALGEILIDFTYAGMSAAGQVLYERNPGGAPANVATAVARLGGTSAFIGKTGNDVFGRFLQETIAAHGILTAGIRSTDEHPTTLAFVTLAPDGERSFSFYRNPGADTQLSPNELDTTILGDSRFLHIGSLSLTHEPARAATLAAIKIVKDAGGYISYDPNWRAPLWKDTETGIRVMKSLFPFADMVKVSDEELALLTNTDNFSIGAGKILEHGAQLVLVTLGPQGVFYKTRTMEGLVGVPPVAVVDTTGAGDAFVGGLLYRLSRAPEGTNPYTKNQGELEADFCFANAVASLCVTKRGAIPAMPALQDVVESLGRVNPE